MALPSLAPILAEVEAPFFKGPAAARLAQAPERFTAEAAGIAADADRAIRSITQWRTEMYAAFSGDTADASVQDIVDAVIFLDQVAERLEPLVGIWRLDDPETTRYLAAKPRQYRAKIRRALESVDASQRRMLQQIRDTADALVNTAIAHGVIESRPVASVSPPDPWPPQHRND